MLSTSLADTTYSGGSEANIAIFLRMSSLSAPEERQRLDVADRAADLGDDDVDVVGLGDQADAVLDLVGDVRDDLHGAAEVVAAALLADDRVVDRARGHVRRARRVGV